ncbi:hypothetical protein PHMEG_0009952 [Phytophthora megakarya]|uniref:Uncharacterized protein n=1 Tax=Phytophthora megakarya TaxID=4795 RepID=A0A225WGX5_9STRA|nr:hypothetical protein PHMEG_0009952 [Phytophthora megakarya]
MREAKQGTIALNYNAGYNHTPNTFIFGITFSMKNWLVLSSRWATYQLTDILSKGLETKILGFLCKASDIHGKPDQH